MQSAYQPSTIHQILEKKKHYRPPFISRLEHYFPKISDLFESYISIILKRRSTKEITRNSSRKF